ncbi:MAG: hypothetical protein MN733_01820, partial [Nitrososphaera sp.]|nr:hypothetical protein [Nitrososphaera sp.]
AKAPPVSNELSSIKIAVIPEILYSGPDKEEIPESGLRDKQVQFLRVTFTDGLALEVPADCRFDVVGRSRTVVRVKTARDLEPGNEVILVESEHQETLSDLLRESLDSGILKEESAKRREWQKLVATVVTTARINLAKALRVLNDSGVKVSYAAVRAWGHGHTVPQHRRVFLLFARAIGIKIPEDEILRYFDHCRRWRIQHRLIGRNLVRSMRLARVGRLDPTSIDRIFRLWELDVRDLIEGTRFAIIDDIETIGGD